MSVIIPCFNPPSGWIGVLESSLVYIRTMEPDCEIIVVNDGSVKNVNESLPLPAAVRLISYPLNRGKGYALRQGVQQARGRFIIYTDVDFPYTSQSFEQIYQTLRSGQDVAIGIREQAYYTHLSKSRVWVSKLLRSLIRLFLHIPTDDTQCGLKGFNEPGKTVFLQTTINRYLFDLEFIFRAAHQNLRMKTVVVQLRPGVTLSTMNWKILLQEFFNFLKIFVQSLF